MQLLLSDRTATLVAWNEEEMDKAIATLYKPLDHRYLVILVVAPVLSQLI